MNNNNKNSTLLKGFDNAIKKICKNNITDQGILKKIIYIENVEESVFDDVGQCVVDNIKKITNISYRNSKNDYIIINPDLRDQTRTHESLQRINGFADYSNEYTGVVIVDLSKIDECLKFGFETQIEEIIYSLNKQSKYSTLVLISNTSSEKRKKIFLNVFKERLVEIKPKEQNRSIQRKEDQNEKRTTRQ